MWKRKAVLATAIAGLMLLGACSSGGSSGSGDSPAGEPKRGGTLKFMLKQDEGVGWDPAILTYSTGFVVTQQMFDTLVEVDPTGAFQPGLAEKWEISSDGLQYTFHLRDGVTFHDGGKMTADDVKFTIERIQNPDTRSPRRKLYSVVQSVTAADPLTVQVKLKEPFAPLLAALADITAGIVSKSAVQAAGEQVADKPVGTGAFKLKKWIEGQSVELVRNESYWGGSQKPYLDGITFTFNSDDNARAAAVRSDAVDFLYQGPVSLWEVLEKDDTLKVYAPEGQVTWLYLLLNQNKPPFDDERVRQAVYYGINRQEMIDLCQPHSTALDAGFLPANHWAANTQQLYKQDYDRARSLLAEAGQSAGFSFTINSLAGWDWQNCTAQAIQQQLAQLKIKVDVKIMETGQLAAQRDAKDMSSDAAMDSMILGFSGTIDPDERFQQTFVTGGGTNYSRFSDPEIDQLVAEARKINDQAKRAEIYRQAQTRLAEVGPFAFLYNYSNYDVLKKDVGGYVFNPMLVSYRQLRDVWINR
jgi:peptide/nickel transport system substrate-binding protein